MAHLTPPVITPALARTAAPSFRLRSTSLNSVRLRRVFDLFDRNGDGEITVAELHLALDRLGLGADRDELAAAVAAYVRPGRVGLCFDDDGAAVEPKAEEEEEEMREAFRVFDENGDGYISAAELQAVLDKLGLLEGRSIDGVRRMISAVDRDRDGRVDFFEFKNMMHTIELAAS
ncbi:hypothetical protein MUK42_16527 [Musa troglodytarum]|uniref:EF-hand domain-containing protein n=1 Tax=Musa troglodytarum TaxID=320322 RepID=A0A9E7HD04_9LILI|nr:hypothetical protein MUK42_16527 [Musa troglodytarum]